jgi:hypothetical protein
MPRNCASSTSRRSRSFSSSRGVLRQRAELGLPQPRVVAGVGEERGALLADRLVEQGACLFERAVEPSAAAQLLPPGADLPQQVVEAAPPLLAREATAQQLAQCLGRPGALEHGLTHGIEGGADVVRRGERIRSIVIGPVPVSGHGDLLSS